MQKKKSRFWLFIWSLVPGAGEMYLGFMKMGVSLMLGFVLLIMVAAITNIGALAVFPVVMYVYSFFHANNLGTLSDAEFYATKDQYLFGMEGLDSIEKMRKGLFGKYRKIAAIVLIVIGTIMLWNMVFDLLVDIFGNTLLLKHIRFFMNLFMNRMPRAVIAIAVIWIGIGLIRGKKVEYIEEGQEAVKRQNVSGEQYTTNGQNVSDVQDSEIGQSGSSVQDIKNEQNVSGGQDITNEQTGFAGQNVFDVQNRQ